MDLTKMVVRILCEPGHLYCIMYDPLQKVMVLESSDLTWLLQGSESLTLGNEAVSGTINIANPRKNIFILPIIGCPCIPSMAPNCKATQHNWTQCMMRQHWFKARINTRQRNAKIGGRGSPQWSQEWRGHWELARCTWSQEWWGLWTITHLPPGTRGLSQPCFVSTIDNSPLLGLCQQITLCKIQQADSW